MLFSYNYLLKFVLLGDEYVGKTSIVSRYFDLPIPCNYESTIGVDFNSKLVYNKSKIYKIQVWDTAGQERFRSIISSYYNGSCGIILVFDLSKYKTFANLEKWINEINNKKENYAKVILVGNKSELNREVSEEEVKAFVDKYELNYIEASVKNDHNIDEIFIKLIDELAKDDLEKFSVNLKKIKVKENRTCCCIC